MLRAICLGDINTEEMRILLGNRNFISGAVAIGGTKSKVKIAAAVDYCIDGQIYHKAITDDLFVHTDLTVQAANTTKWYALSLDAAGAALITTGTATALPKLAATQCIIGAIKIVTTATFTPATTLHDAAGITTTYYNLSCVPVSGLPA
jgi:hypothetical protein